MNSYFLKLKLPSLVHKLLRSNPGSVANLDIDITVFFRFSLLETQTQVAREREQREQQVMSTLEMMSLFKLHVQQVTESARACEPNLPMFYRRALMTWKSALERFWRRSTSEAGVLARRKLWKRHRKVSI